MSRLKRTLAFWVFSYVEPGTAAAAALGVRQPFCSHGGVGMPLFPCLSHRVTTRCGRTLFGDFRLFGVHILLKNMDICGRKVPYVPGVGAQIAGPFPLSTSRRCAFAAEHFKRTFTPPGQKGSRRLRAPLPSAAGRSVFGARASLGLRAGCPGSERWRHNPSHLPFSIPVGLGPALSNPGGG